MKPLNLITLMNYAWHERNKKNGDQYSEECMNLCTHAYAEIKDIIGYNSENEQKLFITFQHLFVFIMKSDNEFLQGEYDAYCKFSKWAKYKPLKVEEVNNLYKKLTIDNLVQDISYIASFRNRIDDGKYEALVLAFCFLSLLGDSSFDENEYYIIRCFFNKGYDYCPNDWETFKREWK